MPLLCKSKFIFRCNFAETISNCTFSPCQWIENTRALLAMAVYIIIIIAIHLKCEIINAPNSTSHTNNNNNNSNSNEYNEYNIKQAWIWWQMITLKVHVLQSDFVLFTESGASERAHKMLKCAYDMAFVRNNVCDRREHWAWSWIIIGKNITFCIINNRFALINEASWTTNNLCSRSCPRAPSYWKMLTDKLLLSSSDHIWKWLRNLNSKLSCLMFEKWKFRPTKKHTNTNNNNNNKTNQYYKLNGCATNWMKMEKQQQNEYKRFLCYWVTHLDRKVIENAH